MAQIACRRTDCAHNECCICGASSISFGADGGCATFISRQEAEKREVEVRLAPFSMSAPVVLLVRSNAPEIVREALSMGFTREKEPPTGFFFLGWSKTTQEKNLVWCRRTTFSDLEGVISEIGSHGYEVKNFILEDDRKKWEAEKSVYDLGKAERWRQLQEMAPPQLPRILSGGYWNGKVYGSYGKDFVYVGGEKRKLTPYHMDEIRNYKRKQKDYRQRTRALSLCCPV